MSKATDMIDQYLDAVASQLPAGERDDIIAELRDLIMNRFEERESELGRALTDEERLEILRAIGHPLVVAARYRKGPDTLIGPELFPYWLFVVKLGLAALALVAGISVIVQLLSDPQHLTRAVMQAVHGYFWMALQLVGAVTVIGALLEHNRIRPRWLTHWSIRDLKRFSSLPAAWIMPSPIWRPAGAAAVAAVRRTLPGRDHVISLVFNSLFLLWWIGLVEFEALTHFRRHGEDVLVTGAPVWTALHGTILVYVLAQIAADLMGLIRPTAVRLQAAVEIVLAIAGLWILYVIFRAGHWFTLSTGTQSVQVEAGPLLLDRDAYNIDGLDGWFAKLGATLSMTLTWAMVFIAFATLVRIVRALRKLAAAS